jgi:coproporphyrinogen III oxidase-like Fe-S oxidoreductase
VDTNEVEDKVRVAIRSVVRTAKVEMLDEVIKRLGENGVPNFYIDVLYGMRARLL